MELGKEGLWPVHTVYTGPIMADMATLRDYFAGQALAGWLAGSLADGSRIVSTTYKTSAELAYMMADAMLRERDKEGK